MNDSDELNENAVLGAVRNSISTLPMAPAPHLDAITTRGRGHRRRRVGELTIAGAGASAALVAGLVSVGGPGYAVLARGPDSATPTPTHTAQLTAFTVVAGPRGTTTLTLYPSQVINPDAVRQALAEHGIPAIVTAGKFCRTADQPAPGVGAVVQLPGQPLTPVPHGVHGASHPATPNPGSIVIRGSAIPSGVKLSIGYRQDPQNREISFTLIKTGEPLSCTSLPDNGPHGND